MLTDGYHGYRKWVDTTMTSARDLAYPEGNQGHIWANDGQRPIFLALSGPKQG